MTRILLIVVLLVALVALGVHPAHAGLVWGRHVGTTLTHAYDLCTGGGCPEWRS